MIENTAHELNGQTELSDFLPKEEAPKMPEGYDAEGRLLNEDYPATNVGTALRRPPVAQTSADGEGATSSVTAQGAVPPSPKGEGEGTTEEGKPSPSGEGGATAPGEVVPKGVDYGPAVTSEIRDIEPHTSAPAADRLNILVGEIHAITEHARVVLASAAIDIGKRLIEAQALVPEGRWSEWLEANVDYSQRQAQVMMQLADQFGRGELPEAFKGLGISHMTALLAAPAEEREDFAQRVQDEGLSVRELKEEIKRLREVREEAQLTIDELNTDIREKDKQIETLGGRFDEAMERIRDDGITARNAIEKEREAARLANAKAAAAEASAEELRRLHSDAEDRAAASAQRASDAVNRANQTAKDLAAARAQIAKLEAEKAAAPEPETRTVEVIPEAIHKELADLRTKLAEAEAKAAGGGNPSDPASGATSPFRGGSGATASEKFKWFYANQMKPAFTTALNLLQEVAREDAHAADLFATALTKGCQQLMGQLGTKEE